MHSNYLIKNNLKNNKHLNNMKKTIKSLLAIAIGAFAFTACSDVPMPEGYNPKQGTGLVDYVPEGSGTATDPYNVAGVIEGTKDLPKGQSTTTDLYTKGYVAEVGEFNASYGNITFYITDSPEGKSKKFYVYRCLGLGGEKFAAADDLKVGDVVTVCGKVKNYNGTFEYDQGSYLVKLNDKSSGGGGGGGEAAEPQGDGSQGNPFNVAGAVVKCQETGETATADAYYIKGKVKTVTEEFNTNYGNGTFTMVDDGFTQTFTAYRVLYLGNKKYTSADTQIKEGDEVIVYGKIVNFKGNTPETSSGAYLYSLNGNTGGGGGEATYGPEAGSGTEAAPYNVAAAVAKCVATGETATTESFYIKGKANADYTVGSYKNVELDIVDDGYTGTFKVFRVKDKEGKGIKEGYKINKGDVIVVYGPVVNYRGNTPETATGAYLVSVNGQAPELDDGQGGGGEGGGGTSGGGEVSGNTITVNAADFGFATGVTATTATLTDGTVVTFDKASGSTNPQYYDGSYASVRVYANNTIAITATKKITKIEFTTTDPSASDKYNGSNTAYADGGSAHVTVVKDSDTHVTFSGLNAESVTITNYVEGSNAKNQLRIKTMVITYAN